MEILDGHVMIWREELQEKKRGWGGLGLVNSSVLLGTCVEYDT